MLPERRDYVNSFDETKYMFFLIKNNESLKKYKKTWNRVSKKITF